MCMLDGAAKHANLLHLHTVAGQCNTCVAQSIAAAVEASVACTLKKDAARFGASASTLYYCSQGSRSCKTGWDIQDALVQLVSGCEHCVLGRTIA